MYISFFLKKKFYDNIYANNNFYQNYISEFIIQLINFYANEFNNQEIGFQLSKNSKYKEFIREKYYNPYKNIYYRIDNISVIINY